MDDVTTASLSIKQIKQESEFIFVAIFVAILSIFGRQIVKICREGGMLRSRRSLKPEL